MQIILKSNLLQSHIITSSSECACIRPIHYSSKKQTENNLQEIDNRAPIVHTFLYCNRLYFDYTVRILCNRATAIYREYVYL